MEYNASVVITHAEEVKTVIHQKWKSFQHSIGNNGVSIGSIYQTQTQTTYTVC